MSVKVTKIKFYGLRDAYWQLEEDSFLFSKSYRSFFYVNGVKNKYTTTTYQDETKAKQDLAFYQKIADYLEYGKGYERMPQSMITFFNSDRFRYLLSLMVHGKIKDISRNVSFFELEHSTYLPQININGTMHEVTKFYASHLSDSVYCYIMHHPKMSGKESMKFIELTSSEFSFLMFYIRLEILHSLCYVNCFNGYIADIDPNNVINYCVENGITSKAV